MAERNNNHQMGLDSIFEDQQNNAANKSGKMGGDSQKSGKAGMRGSANSKKANQRGRQSGA